jgi:ATP-dependent protease Clp ATPase subunit
MTKILTEVRHNLCDQYQWLLAQDGIVLEFSSDAVQTLVDRAMSTGTGARALQSEIERALLPHMFYAKDYMDRGINSLMITSAQINNPTKL